MISLTIAKFITTTRTIRAYKRNGPHYCTHTNFAIASGTTECANQPVARPFPVQHSPPGGAVCNRRGQDGGEISDSLAYAAVITQSCITMWQVRVGSSLKGIGVKQPVESTLLAGHRTAVEHIHQTCSWYPTVTIYRTFTDP